MLPINDEPPELGGGLQGELSCEEGGRVQVTADYLSATDRDSDDSMLTYMIARRPSRGELQRAGATVDKFSQQDVLQGHVYYVHTGEPVRLHSQHLGEMCDNRPVKKVLLFSLHDFD